MSRWIPVVADVGTISTIDGTDESIASARCRIGGHDTVVVASDFEVSAGTLGAAAASRFVEAVEVALAERRPLVGIAASGGTRMGEGTSAFVQMVALVEAVRRVRDAGLPVVVYLAHPTTGGTLASWGSLGHVTLAQPGATVAFTGPRVGAALGEPFDDATAHSSEGFFESGLVDAVVAEGAARDEIAGALDALLGSPVSEPPTPTRAPEPSTDGPRGWAAVTSSRRSDRTDVLETLLDEADSTVRLSGDRVGGRDDATWAGVCRLGGVSVGVVGTLRSDGSAGRSSVAGLRTATRLLRIADELALPMVSILDTAGAVIGSEAERLGIAGEIARSLDALLATRVPTLSVIAGQACGGGALAWLPADLILAADDAWLAPIAPEAASLIVHRNVDHAAEMADAQGVDAVGLAEAGVIDAVYPAERLAEVIVSRLGSVPADPGARAQRFSRLRDG